MSEAKKSSVNEEVLALSTVIKSGITIDAKAGTAKAADGIYEKNLTEGLSMEIVKAVSDYNTTFVAAGAHAFGEAAVESMKGHKSLDKLTVDIPMGHKDSVTYTVDRSKTMPNRFSDKPDDTITKHGVVSTTYDVRAGKNGGQLKAARSHVGELAAKLLAK